MSKPSNEEVVAAIEKNEAILKRAIEAEAPMDDIAAIEDVIAELQSVVVDDELKVASLDDLEEGKVKLLEKLEKEREGGNQAVVARVELEVKGISEAIQEMKEHIQKMKEKKSKLKAAGQVPYRSKGEILPHEVVAVKGVMGITEIRGAFDVPAGVRPYSSSDVLHCSKVFEEAAISLAYTSYPNHPKIQSVLADLLKVYKRAAKAVMEIHNEAEEARLARVKKRHGGK